MSAVEHASPAARLVLDGLKEALRDEALREEVRALLADLAPPAAPDPASARQHFTTASLAAELGVTDRTIRKAISSGALAATWGPGKWVISAEAASAWIAAGRPATRDVRVARALSPVKRAGGLAEAFDLA